MNDAHATGTHLTCDLADGDVCQKPSGRPCIEDGCTEPAGTQWGPYFCPDHDAARIDLISGSLEASSRPRAVPFAPPVVGGVVLDIALDQHNAIISADPDANLQVMQDIQRVLREVGNER